MCRGGATGPWRAWQWGLELTRSAQPGDVLATVPARAALAMQPADLALNLAALRIQEPLHSAQPGPGLGSAAHDGSDRARSAAARPRFEGYADLLGWRARVLAARVAAAVPMPLAALAAKWTRACTADEAAGLREALKGAHPSLQPACQSHTLSRCGQCDERCTLMGVGCNGSAYAFRLDVLLVCWGRGQASDEFHSRKDELMQASMVQILCANCVLPSSKARCREERQETFAGALSSWCALACALQARRRRRWCRASWRSVTKPYIALPSA